MPTKIKIKFIIKIIMLYVISSAAALSSGLNASMKKTEFLNALSYTLNSEIPHIETVIPGYKPTNENRHKILINNFHGNTKHAFSIGYALAEVLRFDVSKAAGNDLYMPGYHYFYRDWNSIFLHVNDKNSPESLSKLANIWGVHHTVSGTINIIEDEYTWKLDIIEAKSKKPISTNEWKGKLDNIPYALNQARRKILLTFIGENAKSTGLFSVSSVNSYKTLEKYGEFLTFRSENNSDEVEELALELWASGLKLPAIGEKIMKFIRPKYDTPAFYPVMMSSVTKTIKHQHIQGLHTSMQGSVGDASRRSIHIEKLKNLIQEYPDDPTLLISLSWLLSGRGHELSGLSVAREVISRWPNLYRGWFTISNALFKYSWLIRGNDTWRNVSADGRRQFSRLQEVAAIASDNCYSLSYGHAACVISKMTVQSGYSSELMSLFHEAIKSEPHNKTPYRIALNFSAEKWGGSINIQEYILEEARKNNHSARWIEDIRKKWAPNVKAPITYKTIALLIIIVFIILIAGMIYYKKVK